MIGTMLTDIRDHIESLASEAGRYYLVCGRTGDRPVPADGLYFEARAVARAAAQATEQYRAVLRRYDPSVPTYDVIVFEEVVDARSVEIQEEGGSGVTGERQGGPFCSEGAETRGAIDFCHTVAGVVFEAIADSSHVGLENAVMDTYLDVAETIDHPDELCLRLLDSIAAELDARLDPAEQASLLATAADALPIDPDDRDDPAPLVTTLAVLQSVGLLESARVTQSPADFGPGQRSWSVRLDGYALGEPADRLVTLPIVVGLFARLSTRSLAITEAERVDRESPATWRLRITATESDSPRGLVCVRAPDRT
ncbi:hypothetical protein ACFO5R_07165 [Halosolutus amylolyticus]|uniref:Uncharacterized protein n=1 Tax=Halosolutus amylolyticus TaxID=2932267 RepID=A0ABD5PMX0_9EURY|nr:hypothetical protein [Halosolutus amylolyticus]